MAQADEKQPKENPLTEERVRKIAREEIREYMRDQSTREIIASD